MNANGHLIELGTSIADGSPIDWSVVDGDLTTARERDVAAQLRLVEQIAQIHATLLRTASSGTLHPSILHPSADDPPIEGTTISWGPLTIVEKIGRGTFGDVYRAH